MTLTTTITICIFILGITFGLMKIIYDIVMKRVENVESKQADQAIEINTLKNFNTMVVDRIEKDIEKLNQGFEDLKKIISDKIRKDSEIIAKQKDLIERMNKLLDERTHI